MGPAGAFEESFEKSKDRPVSSLPLPRAPSQEVAQESLRAASDGSQTRLRSELLHVCNTRSKGSCTARRNYMKSKKKQATASAAEMLE